MKCLICYVHIEIRNKIITDLIDLKDDKDLIYTYFCYELWVKEIT